MKLIFWGVRGSIPAPFSNNDLIEKLRKTLVEYNESEHWITKDVDTFLKNADFESTHTFGGNTPCVELQSGKEIIILDAGTGIRPLGADILKRSPSPTLLHIFLSHTHWDHIAGFPFFIPAYLQPYTIRIYAPFPDLQERLEYQQNFKFYPVALKNMSAKLEFIVLQADQPLQLGDGLTVRCFKHNHPGDSYAYSFEKSGKKVVYSTDNEIYGSAADFVAQYKNFIENSDLLIFDAQYTLDETFRKITWGHSSPSIGVEMAFNAKVRNLVLFHLDPLYTDAHVSENLQTAREYLSIIQNTKKNSFPMKVQTAYEGMTIEI